MNQPDKKAPNLGVDDVESAQNGPGADTDAGAGETHFAAKSRRRGRTSRLPEIEGYEIEGMIGRGGMGVVFRARDHRLNRTVALKTVQVARSNRQTRERIQQEAQSLAQLQHPGVVQIYEVGHVDDGDGEHQSTPFIAMEYVHGPGLDQMNDGNPLDPKAAAEIVYELARTLQACHEKGVVHRDLKPANVLMASPVEPKLTDFGLARIVDSKNRMTQTGEVMGTPGYMAPEQASGVVKNVGPAADIYGLGAILYQLTTGRPPFMAPDPVQTVMQVLTADPPAPSSLQPKLPKDLETITLKCLEKKPKHRYQSCQELADDLKRYLQKKPITARPTPAHRKTAMWIRRHPAVSSLITLAVIGIMAAFAGFSFHINSLQNELDRSQRIINEGRELSIWLLDDFNKVMHSSKGLTYTRSKLADRTQQYLNALLKEATNDEDLKADLAYAFTKLADLQGEAEGSSLGQTEEAEKSLRQAEQLLASIDISKHERAQKVFCLINMHRANRHMVEREWEKAREKLQATRDVLEGDCLLEADDRLLIRGHLINAELRMARARGDQQAMQELTKKLKEVSDRLIQSDVDSNIALLSILNWTRASQQFLEPARRYKELLEILEGAMSQAEELVGENPTIDDVNFLANLRTDYANVLYRMGQFGRALESYRESLKTWQDYYQQDSRNHVAAFNVAKSWQSVGETLNMMSNLEETEKAYQQAAEYYEIWSELTGKELESLDSWAFFQGSLAELYLQQERLEEARTAVDAKIDFLKTVAPQEAHMRRALGDALLARATIEGHRVFAEANKLANHQPHRLRPVTEEVVAMFQQTADHFQQMVDAGFGSEVIKSQRDRALSIIEELETQLNELERLEKAYQSDY